MIKKVIFKKSFYISKTRRQIYGIIQKFTPSNTVKKNAMKPKYQTGKNNMWFVKLLIY